MFDCSKEKWHVEQWKASEKNYFKRERQINIWIDGLQKGVCPICAGSARRCR